MNLRFLVFSALSLALPTAALRADDADLRFSQSLAQIERSDLGLARLSSDQLAVLDALVRRDATQARLVATKPERAATFTARLSADERHNAGLEQLTDTERGRLDQIIEARLSPPSAGTFAVAPAAPIGPIPSVKIRRGLEVHGAVELVVGVGSHGYSEYGGAAVVSVEDPASGMTFAVGYSELRTKGGYYYRDCPDRFLRRPGSMGW